LQFRADGQWPPLQSLTELRDKLKFVPFPPATNRVVAKGVTIFTRQSVPGLSAGTARPDGQSRVGRGAFPADKLNFFLFCPNISLCRVRRKPL